MLIGVDTTTWVIFSIISFMILSKFLFGKIVGLTMVTTVLSRVIGALAKSKSTKTAVKTTAK